MTKPITLADVAKAMAGLGTREPAEGNRIRVRIPPSEFRPAIQRALDRLRCDHLVHLAAVDNGKTFELHCHLTGAHRIVVTLVTEIPRDDPRIPSLHDLLPPAALAERQIHDFFGIVFEGHPGLKRVILNDAWPEGEYPLRKDWKLDSSKAYGGLPPEGD